MKTNLILISLFFITSSAHAHSKFCPEAELSEEQHKRIKENRKAAKERLQEHILAMDHLTDEQRAVLADCFNRGFCPEAELSEEQREQIKGLRESFRDSVQGEELGRKEKRAARQQLHENILALASLTDTQRDTLNDCFERKKKHRRRHKEGFCPEAELSEAQQERIKGERQAMWEELQNDFLGADFLAAGQKEALAKCFEHRKKHGGKHRRKR